MGVLLLRRHRRGGPWIRTNREVGWPLPLLAGGVAAHLISPSITGLALAAVHGGAGGAEA
eukprot:scaffold25521_cov22-Tisochrysis_lutea.AAC.2